jgi:hypothetical protein
MEKVLRAFQKTRTLNAATAIVTAYLCCSVLLSLSILVRLLFTTGIILKVFNIAMYLALFFIIPIIAVLWLSKETWRRKLSAKWLFLSLYVFYAIFLAVAFVAPFIPEYLLLWFPVPLMVALYAKWNGSAKGLFKRRSIVFLVSGLVIAVLLPNAAAFVGVDSLMNQTGSMGSEAMKASFLSERVRDMTAFGYLPRAETDYWKFLLSGAGQCGEMAVTGVALMKAAGLVARTVVIPGEDHEVIEVWVDGNWLVAAPGDSGGLLITRAEMAAKRVEGVGSLSYVVAQTETGFIELTQQYEGTDTITIVVTRNGEPLADAQVVLKHRFGSLTTQLPCDGREFHTDVNGAVTLHLGKMCYINEFKGSEEYYWIYVNGQNTGHNVTSTGTGQIQSSEIDLG